MNYPTKRLRRITSLVLALTLILSSTAGAEIIREASSSLGTGIRLANGVYYNTDRQTENYFVYTPNTTISPLVVYGSKVCNYGDFDTMASLLTNKGYNVVGGINGDFYDLATYQPVGIVITEGILRASDAGHYAMAFREDGTAFISKPALEMRVKIGTENYRLGGINKVRTGNEYFLFNEDFSYTTKNSAPGRDVILSVVQPEDGTLTDGKLRVNCTLTLMVEEIRESQGEITLPEGKYVLSLAGTSDEWRQYGIDNLNIGDTLTVEVKAEAFWDSVSEAIGSYVKLVSGGAVDASIPDSNTHRDQHPRTAAGIKPDGTVILYTVDGRQSGYSAGISSVQVAERLIELGCTEAILLDGGGSTNLHALYIGSASTEQVNRPSDGKERSVTNYIILAAKGQGSGSVRNIGVFPYDALVLAGSSLQFTAGASDETSRRVSSPQLAWSVSTTAGTVSASGLFTAGSNAADLSVYASYGDARGEATVSVIEKPSEILILNEKTGREIGSLGVVAGETLELKAAAYYKGIELACSDEAVTWSVSDGAGAIDKQGNFTASEFSGTGVISASAGGVTVSIDVVIRTENAVLSDFESGDMPLIDSAAASVYRETERDYVKNGYGSAKIVYEPENGEAFIPALIAVGEKMNYVSLFVYGNGSGATLEILFENGEKLPVSIIEFSGWWQAVVKLPFSGADIAGFYVKASSGGTIYLDQIMASTSPEPDKTPPDIQLELVDGRTIAGFVVDAIEGVPDKSHIELSYDGKPLEFSLNSSSGKISAVLPIPEPDESEEEEGLMGVHKLFLRASDKSGNTASASLMLEGISSKPFYDMEGHWSGAYVDYMYSMGIVNGIETEYGYKYDPDSPVTRAQFAVMAARYLGLDLSEYEDAVLNFEDRDMIPDYALPAVKAVTALGIIRGSVNNGHIVFEPGSALTRAQAMTIAGRIQPGGYTETELSFPDSGDVPIWSLRYVMSLVGQGVISGYTDGRLMPNATLTRAQVAKILSEI